MSKPPEFPAFPICAGHHVFHTGMELRDWFAGQALAGMMASSSSYMMTRTDTAHWAYVMADAMIAARKGGEP